MSHKFDRSHATFKGRTLKIQIPGLRVNFTKSNMLCCNVPATIQLKASHALNVTLEHKSFNYPGISIPKHLNKMYQYNYKIFLWQIKMDPSRYAKQKTAVSNSSCND